MKKRRLPFLMIGLAVLCVFLLMAAFPRLFTRMDAKTSFGAWLPPSAEHILGTNSLGYDVFAELVYGAKGTLFVGLCSSALALLLGVTVGILSSVKGVCGAVFGGIVNVFAMLPRLIILIVLSAFVGNSPSAVILLIAAFGWVGTARAVRARVVHVKSLPFIEACEMYGYSKFKIAVRHILPNLYDVILSRFLLGVNGCIMTESALGFLGIGDLYRPSWGVMIGFAKMRGALVTGAYGYLLAPCLCIVLLSLSFYFISLYFEGRKEEVGDPG